MSIFDFSKKRRLEEEQRRLEEEQRREELRRKIEELLNKNYTKEKNNRYYNYNGGYLSHNIDTSLDNAYQLMKLNKNDSEITIKKKYRELSLK